MRHHYCQNIDILNRNFIRLAILDCLDEKWHRDDVIDYFHLYLPSFSREEVKKLTYYENRVEIFSGVINSIAEDIRWELEHRDIHIKPIRYSNRFDGASGKMRKIGIQCIKQQILDHIAVIACFEIWEKRIAPYQCASIKGRGQIYGKKMVEHAIRDCPEKATHAVKGDIRKCYPSINVDILKDKLAKDIDNDVLLYLLFFLIDTFEEGLSIGSYLSQFLSNYYISFVCKSIERDYIKKCTAIVFYMDDFLFIGNNKTTLIVMMKETIRRFEEELDLHVKPTWEVFPIDRVDSNGKRHGRPIDMMGYVMYRDHTEIRDTIFLRARRLYIDTYIRYAQFNHQIPLALAYKAVSYYGWFKNSNSCWFIRDYNIKKIVNMSKTSISYHNNKRRGRNKRNV